MNDEDLSVAILAFHNRRDCLGALSDEDAARLKELEAEQNKRAREARKEEGYFRWPWQDPLAIMNGILIPPGRSGRPGLWAVRVESKTHYGYTPEPAVAAAWEARAHD